jgi:hypothetical protein
MRCPNCAESIGVSSLLRRRCPHCRLEFERSTSASPELRRLVAERRLRLRWLVAGALVTAAVSVVPSAGLLQFALLAPLQVFCIERATGDVTRNLPTLSAFGFELASGLLFIALAAASTAVGASLESMAGLVTVPLFVATYFAARQLALQLGTRAVDGKGPGLLLGVVLAFTTALVFLPPLILGAVAISLSHSLAAHEGNPHQVLQLATMGTLGSLDLFLMPAWLAALLGFLGLSTVAPAFGWASSWWFVLIATGAVCAEAVIDNAFDRRRRFSRTIWPAVQAVLTPPTLLFMVCVLGTDLDWPGRVLALAAGLAGGWQLRRGVNRAKTAMGFFPGLSLARRRARLFTIPFRLGLALGAVALAQRHSELAAIVIASAMLFSAGLLAASWWARRLVRSAARMPCAKCQFEMLRSARVCPRCHHAGAAALVGAIPMTARPTAAAVLAFVGADAAQVAELGLEPVPPPEVGGLERDVRALPRSVARDLLGLAASVFERDDPRLAEATRLVAHRRAFALFEET